VHSSLKEQKQLIQSTLFVCVCVCVCVFVCGCRGRYEQPFSEYKQLHYDFQILVQAASGLRPTLPEATPKPLVDLYKACTDAKPELRPSAAEVVERLQDILNEYRYTLLSNESRDYF
jgi:hypothetical protein